MSKSIKIANAEFSDVPYIDVPQVSGGTARFVDEDDVSSNVFEYGGTNAELVSSYSETFTLAGTSFVVGSSASTSATSIKATVSNRFTSQTIAIGEKDIVVVQRYRVTPTHDDATGKTQMIRYAGMLVSQASKRKTSDTSANTTRQFNSITSYILKYFNSSGTAARTQTNYGFYMTCQTPSFASSSAASTTVRASSPVLYYRASSTYESTANIKKVTECTFEWSVEVYLVDPSSTMCRTMHGEIDNMLLS